MKDSVLALVIFSLVLGFIVGFFIGAASANKIQKANAPKIPDPLVTLGKGDALRIEIFFEGEMDEKLPEKISDVGEAFRLNLLPAMEKSRRDDDDTQLQILKARIKGDKQTEYRLMMKERWLKMQDMRSSPQPNPKD